MNIDDVTPTGSAVMAESTEATSSDAKSTTSGSVEMKAETDNKDEKEHHHEHATSSSKEVESGELENGSSEMTDASLEPHSSTELPSAKGCKYNGTSYEVGHEILNGCDSKCTCMENGEVKCMERCSLPMFKKGAFAHDNMCFEEPSGVDECCVIIACARGAPGEAETRELIPIHPEPCDSVKCGKNARCLGPSGMLGEDENQTNQTLCLCNEGFVGDPYDEIHGCQASVPPSASSEGASPSSSAAVQPDGPSSTSKPEGCIFNNQTFEFGDEHFDGCNYKCRCENSGEFTCLPRCNYRRDEEKEIPLGCEIQKDPSDSCCEMLVCHGTPLESGTRKDEPTIPDDGCVYKNKSYARDEKFYDGCESQ
ncbi:putative epidermal cell surface receptor, partial [Orchesella cincta]